MATVKEIKEKIEDAEKNKEKVQKGKNYFAYFVRSSKPIFSFSHSSDNSSFIFV